MRRPPSTADDICPACGYTLADFEQTGIFGCDVCYSTFHEDISALLRRIHGSSQHIGSRPKSKRVILPESDLHKLREELASAIQNEQFETAAKLRDMIRDIEREQAKGSRARKRTR
jgi:protein arginine kinase activator